ncbi:MAG TPA: cation-transporting P-type ATPase, partial [Mucilaginibacter sp.]
MADTNTLLKADLQDAKKPVTETKGKGLSQTEADALLKQYGYNEITENKAHPLLNFLSKFWGLTAWMLEFIVVLSIFLHNLSDAYVVGGLLV